MRWFLLITLRFVSAIVFRNIYVKFGVNVGEGVKHSITHHLRQVRLLKVHQLTDQIIDNTFLNTIQDLSNGRPLLLLIGNSTESLNIISNNELNKLEPESFKIVSTLLYDDTIPTLACNGLPLDYNRNRNISFSKDRISYGAVLSAYVCLEHLGFAFLHPLEPYYPYQISFNPKKCDKYTSIGTTNTKNTSNSELFCHMVHTESPYWPERSFHIHTQHPLELTEVIHIHIIIHMLFTYMFIFLNHML